MKKLLAVALVLIVLSPALAFAGSSTDAALGLSAFAVFNQILSGTGIFGGFSGARGGGRPALSRCLCSATADLSAGARCLRSATPGSGRATRPGLRSERRYYPSGGTTHRRPSTGTRRVQSRLHAAGARPAT